LAFPNTGHRLWVRIFFVLPLLVAIAPAWGKQPPPPPPDSPPPPPPADEEVVGAPPGERATTPRDRTQDGLTPQGPGTMQEDIVVTGSRIRRKDLTGPAPVVVYSRDQIQATGRVNIGEFLQSIPEQSNAIGRSTNNGGEGAIRVNLRGIGTAATLVLLNGRRVVPGGTGADDSVDLSSIPTNVIERVEILKDGASAIYGSDAIGGVINIITRKRIDGGEISVLGGTSQRGDGNSVDVNAMLGTTSDRGSIMLSLAYYRAAPVWAGERDFSLVQKTYNSMTNTETRLGSGTIPEGRVVLPAAQAGMANGNQAWNDLVGANPTATSFIRDANGMWRPFKGVGLPPDQDGWNYQPSNYLVTPQQRFTVFLTGEHRLGQFARAYVDSFYTKRNSKQTLAPEPLLTDLEGVTVSGANIYNPFGRDFDAVRRRLTEFGNRSTEQDIHNFHVVTGIDGTTPDSWGPLRGWFWDFSGIFSQNESTELKTGNLNLPKLRDAVGPSFRDANGVARCGTMMAPIEGCTPLNLFGGPGSISRNAMSPDGDQVTGLTFSGIQRGDNRQIGAAFSTSGDLFNLAAERPVGLALGYEFRRVSGGQIPDPITVAGETSGNKGLITQGSYYANEVFGELAIPIIDQTPGAHKVELILAARNSIYDKFGSTFNYKFGALYSPVQDLSIRGTYSTAFRAPSIPELYGGISDDFANVADPCAMVAPGSPRAAACGAAANNGDDQQQLRARVGGNDKLRPETARVFTAGLVIEPRWVKGMYVTADYFNTKISSRITPLGANVILQGCYPDAAGIMPKYCDLIVRDAVTQRIDTISNLDTNVGLDRLDGVDLTAGYDFDSGVGRWGLQGVVSYLRVYDRTLADGSIIKGAGTWDLNDGGSGGAYPHLRFSGTASWSLGGLAASVRTYFIGSYKECGDADGLMEGGGLCYDPSHQGERTVSSYNTWDLTLGYGFKSGAGRTAISLGVINLLDQRPPLVYNGFANTTDTYSYDLMLRQFFAFVKHVF
jgi:iron complex outermembrane recepter protein